MADGDYTLYGDIGSGSAAVELALAEIGAPCRIESVPLECERQRDERYAAVNAQRKLPTLVTPEGVTLTESAAILLYLADRHPEANLLPATDTPDRSTAIRWLVFVAAELYPLIEIIDYPQRFLPELAGIDDAMLEATRDRVRQIWKRRWLLLQSRAAGKPWFLVSGFSALDLYVAVVSRWAQLGEWRGRELRRVEAIADAVAARERCAPIWTRHFGVAGDSG